MMIGASLARAASKHMLMEEEVTQLTAGMAYSLQKHQQGKIPKKKIYTYRTLNPFMQYTHDRSLSFAIYSFLLPFSLAWLIKSNKA